MGNKLFEDNFCYAVEEIHAYDNAIYQNNINVVSSDNSPRFFANHFMSMLMGVFGGNWNSSALLLILINYLLYAVAFTMIINRIFKKNFIFGAMLISFSTMYAELISLGFDINYAADVFMGTAVPLAMIAIALVIGDSPKWNTAWIILALSEFMHVHEGIWAGSVVGLLWISACIADRKINWKQIKSLPIYICSVLLVVFPSLLNTESVDDKMFNYIYAYIRTPHHLLPSRWGLDTILLSCAMNFLALYMLYDSYRRTKDKKLKKACWGIAILSCWWIVLVVVQYISVEVISLSFITTMYLPKCFKYITWMVSLVYAKYAITDICEKRYMQGLCLAGLLIVPAFYLLWVKYITFGIYIALMIFYVACKKMDLDKKIFKDKNDYLLKIISYVIIVAAISVRLCIELGVNKTLLTIPVFITVGYILFIKSKIKVQKLANVLLVVSLVLSIICTSAGAIYSIDGNEIKLISGDEYVRNAVGEDLYELAKEFENLTDLNDMFLADPDSAAANGFQLVSHRSCYAIYKNTPSNKNVVIEWYERIENVRKMTTCTAKELKELMNDIDVNYVLVDKECFNMMDESELFSVVVKNGEYAVYKIRST
jgi:hypothetical protein